MEAVVGIIIGLAILAGLYFLVFKKKQPKPKEVKGFKEYNLKVANLTAKGMEENRDFVVAIIGLPEFKSKSHHAIEDWIKGKVGQEGRLSPYNATLGLQELTYTTIDNTIDVFFLIVEETSQPVIDWQKPIEPETPIEPEPTNRKIVNVQTIEGDNTAILREPFKEDQTTYKLPKDGRAFAFGVLESDEPNAMGLRLGWQGLIRLEGRKDVEIDGQNFTLWNDEPAVLDYYPEGHEKFGQKYPKNGYTMSKRKFFRVLDCERVWIHDINLESGNLTPDDKPGRPDYEVISELEHGIHSEDTIKLAIENLYAKGIWGDGTYILGSYEVYMRNVTIDWNGRQGGAMISGGTVYLERYNVLNSRRSAYDIEGNVGNNDSDGFVLTYSKFFNHLLGLPMGGPGFVKNVLSINNFYQNGTIFCEGNETGRKRRENIMFIRNKARNIGDYFYTTNILIDGIEQDDIGNNKLALSKFYNCKNITIRNCNLPNYGHREKGEEEMFLLRVKDTPVSEFKIYNNAQKIGLQYVDQIVRADQVEIGKLYAVYNTNDTDFNKLEPTKGYYNQLIRPERVATIDDFIYIKEFETLEEASNDSELLQGRIYKIAGKPYVYLPVDEGDDFQEMTVEDLGTLTPVIVPEEYVPTEKEAVSIPFPTDNPWIDFQWERLYTNGFGWRPENYQDDGWRPDWLIEMKK